MLLREFNDFCTVILCVSALWQKLGEKGISAAPVYTGEKPKVETIRGEIANPDGVSNKYPHKVSTVLDIEIVLKNPNPESNVLNNMTFCIPVNTNIKTSNFLFEVAASHCIGPKEKMWLL